MHISFIFLNMFLHILFFKEGLKQFEESLGMTVAKLTGESLIKPAQSVVLKSMKIFGEFEDIVQTRKKAELERLAKNFDFIEEDDNALREICQIIKEREEKDGIFTEDAIKEWLNEYERAFLRVPMERASHRLLDKVNDNIKDTMANKREQVRNAFESWKNNAKWSYRLYLSTMLSDESPKLSIQALPEHRYTGASAAALTASVGLAGIAGILTGGLAGT